MPAPRDSDLSVRTYHRHTITYAGTASVLAGTAIGFDRLPATGTQPIFGILESDVSPGQDVTIAVAGVCQMLTGAAIAIGASVGVDSTSRAITVAAGTQSFGRALSAATAAGQKIQVLITREGTN
jgi:hypothetical protein